MTTKHRAAEKPKRRKEGNPTSGAWCLSPLPPFFFPLSRLKSPPFLYRWSLLCEEGLGERGNPSSNFLIINRVFPVWECRRARLFAARSSLIRRRRLKNMIHHLVPSEGNFGDEKRGSLLKVRQQKGTLRQREGRPNPLGLGEDNSHKIPWTMCNLIPRWHQLLD